MGEQSTGPGSAGSTGRAGHSGARGPLLLFVVALALRLAAAFALGTPEAGAGQTPWQVGGEAPTLAASLADGGGLANPWMRPDGAWAEPTGPSSWLTPVYPALVAVCFALGGSVSDDPALPTSLAPGVTAASLWILYALQALVSAGTCVLLVALGRRLDLPRTGRLAGWLFALYPLAIWNAVGVVWDTTLVAFALVGALVALLAQGRSAGGLARSGLCFGGLLLLNPAPVALLPGIWVWIGRLRHAALFTAVALAVCAPWMLRNQRVLGTLAPRPNFGVELRIGNHDGATGRPLPFRTHPSHVEAERELYVELGEVAYASENAARAKAWIADHPGRFAALTARRAMLFWWGEPPGSDARSSGGVGTAGDPVSWVKFCAYALCGAAALVALALAALGGALAREHAFLLILALAGFGGPYYLTHVSERYRFPIDPLLVLLDAWLLLWLLRRPETARDRGGRGLDAAGPA